MRLYLLFALCLSLCTSELHGQCPRQLVLNNYRTKYLANQLSLAEVAWTGDISSCTPGAISKSAESKTLKMIHYFRELCGLPAAIEWDTAYNRKAQEAALMMLANNDLSHNPPASWTCYTEAGKEGAGKSNLALGYHTTQAITAYMADYGESNYAVGHRRWILFPRAKYFGLGSTSRSQALWVIGRTGTDPKPAFVAYPAPGFFPKPLVYPRWSFSKDGADFSQATVTMSDGNHQAISLKILPIENGFGANTLVWEPVLPGVWLSDQIDRKIIVTVQNVRAGGQALNFSYEVDLTTIRDQPVCEDRYIFNGCHCELSITSSVDQTINQPQPRLLGNPVIDRLRVEGIPEQSIAEIRSLAGQLLLQTKPYSPSLELPLNLPSGVYLLMVISRQRIYKLRFIKL